MERETERDRGTKRQGDKETERQKERERERDTHTRRSDSAVRLGLCGASQATLFEAVQPFVQGLAPPHPWPSGTDATDSGQRERRARPWTVCGKWPRQQSRAVWRGPPAAGLTAKRRTTTGHPPPRRPRPRGARGRACTRAGRNKTEKGRNPHWGRSAWDIGWKAAARIGAAALGKVWR